MKTKATIACALTLLSLAGKTFAQTPPAPVTGVTAQALNGQVVVQWNPVTSDPIEYYRVYYSNYSILDNDGLYDDFEVTQGNETTLTFVPPADLNDLYIAVIAVSQNGAESEFFTEETYVKVSTGGPAVPPPQPTPDNPDAPEIPEHTSMKLLRGEVLSPTEMRVEFSTSVTVEPDKAPQGLRISRPNGSSLQITGITIDDKTIIIKTVTQQRGVVYNVQFSEPFEGRNGQPLDPDDRSVLLTGHPEGNTAPTPDPSQPLQNPAQPPLFGGQSSSAASSASSARSADPYNPPDIANVTMVPQMQPNGLYTVTLEWTVDNTPGDLYGYVVYQTRDGQTFGPPSILPIDIRGVQLPNVTPGFYGLYIQTVNLYGYVSTGVFQYANLPAYAPGHGLQGNLTFGGMNADDTMDFGEVNKPSEDMATLEAMSDDTPTEPLKGGPKLAAAAAAEEKPINWAASGVMATAIAGTIISLVGLFVMFTRKFGS